MAAKQTQEQKDFNKSKRGLLELVNNLNWNTIEDENRVTIKSVLDTASNQIEPLSQDIFLIELKLAGPQKRKQIQAFLAGKAKIQMK